MALSLDPVRSPSAAQPARALPRLVRLGAALLGIAWNLFGIVQFLRTVGVPATEFVARGMTESQAALVAGLPLWMDLAFAIGVGGGLLGSIALLVFHRAASPILAVSTVAYAALFVGDAIHGLFDALPGQLAILSTVVLIAVALWAVALRVRRDMPLR
ncbi:MAG: hypothetical protein WCK28_21120 [Burkholderiales bacterium]|jgi:hypothetical protein